MEEVRVRVPQPHLLRRLSEFGRSMHRTLMLEVVGIGGHTGAGGFPCSITHLKLDNRLLINSQAVYRKISLSLPLGPPG